MPQGALSLTEGDIAIVGMQAAGSETAGVGYDSFTFVTLVDLTPGTRIYFTDTNTTGTEFFSSTAKDFNGKEGLGYFEVAPGHRLRAGTVISSANTSDAFFFWKTVAEDGTVEDLAAGTSLLDLQTTGDQIYAFQSSASLTSKEENPLFTTAKQTHLSAIGTHSSWSYKGTDLSTSALPISLDEKPDPTVFRSPTYASGATFFNLSAVTSGFRTRTEWLTSLEVDSNWSGSSSGAFTLPTTSFAMVGGLNLTWNAGSGAWGATAANWKDASGNTTRFLPKDNVSFSGPVGGIIAVDAAGVTAGNLVLNPSEVLYHFTGGPISATSLQKSNGGSAIVSSALNLSGDVTVDGGTLTLSGSNTYAKTVLNGGTLIAANNAALGTGVLTFNGGALASDNGNRVLGNALVVNKVAGNTISGGSNLMLTGGATGSGKLTVAFDGNTNSLTVGGAQFAPGEINLTKGSLILNNSNTLGDSTRLTLAGGTFKTQGFSESIGVLTLTFNSVIDLGTGNSVLQFANSRNEAWSGVLRIDHWSGNAVGGGVDRILFGSSFSTEANAGISNAQRNLIYFLNPDGFAPGLYLAKKLQSGEVVPGEMAAVPEPSTIYTGGVLVLFALWRERKARGKRQ